MKVPKITYRRVKNLGNYESEAVEMTAEVQEHEDVNRAMYELQQIVKYHLDLPPHINEDF